jgi:stage II sporulation protein P
MGSVTGKQALPPSTEKITFDGTYHGKYRGFAVFLICCALLLAGFAISTVAFQGRLDGWLFGENQGQEETQPPTENQQNGALESDTTTQAPPSENEKTPLPEGATPILSKDLSCISNGALYLHNETPYAPELSALLQKQLVFAEPTQEPLVLILHTHSMESYQPSGATYIEGIVGDVTYSDDAEQNMLAVGKTLANRLQSHGIGTIHCTIVHDVPTLGGAYDRSAETVKYYLKEYPSIRYVIDLHRDAVTGENGEIVRAVWGEGEESVAQVMAVVGSDANGTDFPNWEDNLAFALQLREALNAEGQGICRPVYLRNASFHQELAPCSILLEIGTSGNSVDEAKRAAEMVGDALANFIYE